MDVFEHPAMAELRQDPMSGQWVIIAPGRGMRPNDFAAEAPARPAGPCPFCAGHEHLTTPSILEVPGQRAPGEPWRVRVISNLYPAVTFKTGNVAPAEIASHGDPPIEARDEIGDDNAQAMPALGKHEVIVESPEHLLSITELDDRQLAEVLLAYRDRLRALAADGRFRCTILFKNMGAGGGATLEHIHSQLVALAQLPTRLETELTGARRWHERHGDCYYCGLVRRESIGTRQLRVATTERFAVVCPFAARLPYEMWVLPREHCSHFEQISTAESLELAVLLKKIIAAIECLGGAGAYNYVLHSAPFDMRVGGHYHWHIEVIPRVTRLAGFELGSGWYINPVSPEMAAEGLRNSLGSHEGKPKFERESSD